MDANFIPGSGQKENKLKIAIIDPSEEYKNDLKKYYQDSDDIIEVTFTSDSLDTLYTYLSSNDIDIVLLNEKVIDSTQPWYTNLMNLDVAKVIMITEDLNVLNESRLIHENVDLLYKYTPVGTYTQRILSFTTEGKKKDIFTQVNPIIKEQTDQKIALFYSPKGGVGTTTITTNTAAQLTLKEKKVLLVDFAIFGHVSITFNLPQKSRGLADVISYIEQGRREEPELKDIIRSSIQTVNMQGKKLDVLSAASPLKMSSLTLEQTDVIMSILTKLEYDVIIIDSSTDLSERNISLMSAATDMFFVMTTDVAANWSMISSVDILRKLNRPMQNRYLLINAYHDSIGFPVSEMESMLSMKVSTVIPYKYQQIQGYANRGLIMAERPLLKLNKYYRSVAHLIEPIFSKSELARHKGLKKGVVN